MNIFRKRWNATVDFFKPFKNPEELGVLSDEQLKITVLLDRKRAMSTHSENHSVEDGRIRIGVFFWNEMQNEDKNTIVVSTDRLDPKLYSLDSIIAIRDLLKEEKIKILYKNTSENINSLINSFDSSAIKKSNTDINNFLVSENSYSIEKSQRYEKDILVDHEADFYYNTNYLSSTDIIVTDKNEKLAEFNREWKAQNNLVN